MSKKFTFNFTFLDRFRNKPSPPPPSEDDLLLQKKTEEEIRSGKTKVFHLGEDLHEHELENHLHESNRPINSIDVSSMSSTEMQNASHAKSFELPPVSEFSSTESSEDFAEKTLSGHDVSEFRELNPPKKPKLTDRIKNYFPHFSKGISDETRLQNPFKKMERISWNEIVLKLFSPYTRNKIHNIFFICLVLAFTYVAGKSLTIFFNRVKKIDITKKSSLILPAVTNEPMAPEIGRISSVNLFNAKLSEEQKKEKSKVNIAEIICLRGDRPTTIQAKLLNTIVLQDSIKSVASVQVRGMGELIDLREGEKIDNAVEVSKIERMNLVLKNLETGDCEYLKSADNDDLNPLSSAIRVVSPTVGKSLFKSMNPNIQNEGNNFKIKCKFRDEMVSKMSDVLTQAKAVQLTNPDGSLCFKMTEIVPGSVYSQLNIQENDIICNINGKKIDNLNDLMNMLGKIKEIDSMQIGVRRMGMLENFEYNFDCK